MIRIFIYVIGAVFVLYFLISVFWTMASGVLSAFSAGMRQKKVYFYEWPSMAYVMFVAINLYYFDPLGSDGWKIQGVEFLPLYLYCLIMGGYWVYCSRTGSIEITDYPTIFVAAVPFAVVGILTALAVASDLIVTSSADYDDNHEEILIICIGYFISMVISFQLKNSLKENRR